MGHSFIGGNTWNGRRAQDMNRETSLTFGSILAAATGLASPISRRPRPSPASGHGRARTDDAIFVRSGLGRREAIEGPSDEVREGVLPDVLTSLHEREVAVYSGDCIERLPIGIAGYPLPLHHGMTRLGLYFLDNSDVERLADPCRPHKRLEFLLVVAPLRIPGATARAVSPLVVF